MGSRTGVLLRDMSVCAVVAIIYLAYPSLTCPPSTALSSTLREKSGTKERRGHGEETE